MGTVNALSERMNKTMIENDREKELARQEKIATITQIIQRGASAFLDDLVLSHHEAEAIDECVHIIVGSVSGGRRGEHGVLVLVFKEDVLFEYLGKHGRLQKEILEGIVGQLNKQSIDLHYKVASEQECVRHLSENPKYGYVNYHATAAIFITDAILPDKLYAGFGLWKLIKKFLFKR